MPTLFEIFGLRFFFFSNEHEPIHVHAENGDGRVKIKVSPEIELVENKGMKPKEVKKVLKIVKMYQSEICDEWTKYFND